MWVGVWMCVGVENNSRSLAVHAWTQQTYYKCVDRVNPAARASHALPYLAAKQIVIGLSIVHSSCHKPVLALLSVRGAACIQAVVALLEGRVLAGAQQPQGHAPASAGTSRAFFTASAQGT